MRLVGRSSVDDYCYEKENPGMKATTAIVRMMCCLALALLASLVATVAPAVAAAPHWQIQTLANPTYFHAGDELAYYEIVALNNGSAPSSGEIVLRDALPPGLVVTAVVAESGGFREQSSPLDCTVTGSSTQIVECIGNAAVGVGNFVGAKINFEVPADAQGTLVNEASISGGSAGEDSITTSTPVVPPSVKVPYGGSLDIEVMGEDGSVETQAGGRPFAVSSMYLAHVGRVATQESCTPMTSALSAFPTPGCAEMVTSPKDIEVQIPAGLVGNATNVPRCSSKVWHEFDGFRPCPVETQVGVAYLEFFGYLTSGQYAPIYNIEPPFGEPAMFGLSVGGAADIPMHFEVRADGDYGLDVKFSNLTSYSAVKMALLNIWGVPAAPVHDPHRTGTDCQTIEVEGCSAGIPQRPLLRMPTSCSANPLRVPLATDSWGQRGQFVGSDQEAAIAPMSNCDLLEFEPDVTVRPTTNVSDSPTGLHVDLHVPQEEEVSELATPDLKDTVVKLPPGLTLNASAANGLEGCTPSQFGLTTPIGATPIRTTDAPAACPNAAKVGSVEIDSPLLDDPLPGAVYLAKPYDNPFGSLVAIYIAVDDPKSGIVIKLAGEVEVGAGGQLTTRFAESPQLPFEHFKLDFFGGARASLKTPAVCGTYTTTSTLTPWSAPESGPPAVFSDSREITTPPGGGNCPTSAALLPNNPSFEAGTESPIAGAFSPFVLRLKRDDGSQEISSLTVTPPPGLLGKLAGIPYCSDSALAAAATKTGAEETAAPSCPAASGVGVVNVGAGAGPAPYYVQGKAYLAGPYKGAPLSLAVVTPAVAGPFDLGTVVVRAALEVDPYTAQITVKSDPIPTELKNIPLNVRSVAVKMDRSGFTLNPTDCEAKDVKGTVTTTVGQTKLLNNHFQLGECGRLPFKPKLSIALKGRTTRAGHPALTAWLRMPPGGANIARAQVSLPSVELLDQGNLDKVCTQPQIATATCPRRSIYGYAKAWSPLLDKPLKGPVFLGVGYGHQLPDLVAELNGQIRVLLNGRIDTSKSGGIRNTFEVVPDAPVSKFMLRLKGGKKYGLIVNSDSLCKRTHRAHARFVGQNGRVSVRHPKVRTSCKGMKKGSSKQKR